MQLQLFLIVNEDAKVTKKHIYLHMRAMLMVKVGEKYRHYKSTGGDNHTYEVIHIGFFQGKVAYEDQLMIIYKPLYAID